MLTGEFSLSQPELWIHLSEELGFRKSYEKRKKLQLRYTAQESGSQWLLCQ